MVPGAVFHSTRRRSPDWFASIPDANADLENQIKSPALQKAKGRAPKVQLLRPGHPRVEHPDHLWVARLEWMLQVRILWRRLRLQSVLESEGRDLHCQLLTQQFPKPFLRPAHNKGSHLMGLTSRFKALLVVLACMAVFALNALWLWFLDRSDIRSLPWYRSYLTYRALLLEPFMLIPFGIVVIFCLVKLYQTKSPTNERQLYLLAVVCGSALGLVLVALFKL